ncbi:2-dehydropantoate 2-reductase [Desulfonema ishimotonii]|uniref:2-dehydropantoate 2-reductase n=1 Tax=Desulfonema ishimotonii TaxID=45657 RepID=A0A401G1A0_9BACT|nr:2-dehydropantoate 2-reductase [Desulfonema ishimotonii]GBC63018.1 2-dehydropantoate 2-reductase [Desulfonema ishimotonii]
MRIVIIGAGAMGSLFGAMLSSVSEICLVDPFEAHVRAIREKGLVVEQADGTSETFRLSATTEPSEIAAGADLAIIFTKSWLTSAAAETARSLLGKSGVALTLQNGVGNLDAIAEVLGRNRSVAGVTSHGGTLLGPGRVRHAGRGPTFIAGASPDISLLSDIAGTFGAAGIQTEISDNLDSLIWGKLIINVGINALAATLRVPNGILGITPACEPMMRRAVDEAVTVADALGIELPYDNPLAHVKQVCEMTAANRASMLQDVLRGARTEVGVINRAIVRRGEALGIPTPYNLFLSEVIEALEATSAERCL